MIEIAPVPGTLADASKFNGTFAEPALGDTVKLGVGVPAGGRITPGGTRRIWAFALSLTDTCAFDPFGVATMLTTVMVPPLAGGGAGGAVYNGVCPAIGTGDDRMRGERSKILQHATHEACRDEAERRSRACRTRR